MTLKIINCAPSNDGEIAVRNYLKTMLDHTEGFLLTNYHHPVNNGTLEHDLILINQQGVWCLEVKNWHGPIKADQIYWEREDDGYRSFSPLKSVEHKVKNLVSTLENARFRDISVVGMVVLAQPENITPLNIKDAHEYKVFRLNRTLIYALTGREYLHDTNNQMLSPALMTRIVNLLVPRIVNPRYEIVHNYRLVCDLGEGELFHVYEGWHVSIPDRYARLKKYHIPVTSTQELYEATLRFRQDMLALSKVGNHPNIVRIYDYEVDPHSNDTYWLILERVKGDTLQDWLDHDDKPIAWDKQLHIMRSLAAALEYCYSKGIIHRNLNPSSIYISDDDGTVKLGDFDYARVPDPGRTISVIGKPLIVNRYTAPELRKSGRDADARSDLYALGALWYDMTLRPDAREGIMISRIREAPLSGDAVTLLQRLLEPEPANRPASAQEVKAILQTL